MIGNECSGITRTTKMAILDNYSRKDYTSYLNLIQYETALIAEKLLLKQLRDTGL